MRDSVRKLQVLWREHHRPTSLLDGTDEISTLRSSSLRSIDEHPVAMRPSTTDSKAASETFSAGIESANAEGCEVFGGIGSGGDVEFGDREQKAGRKLQALSRGMLARRNFGRIKQETLAMIVIQRTLLRRRQQRQPFAGRSAERGGLPPSPSLSPAQGSTSGSKALLSFWEM